MKIKSFISLALLSLCATTLTSCSFESLFNGFTSSSENTSQSSSLEYKEEYTITFDSNGGTSVASQIVKHGNRIQEPADPTRSYYTFTGWTYMGHEWLFPIYTVTSDITLEANWTYIGFISSSEEPSSPDLNNSFTIDLNYGTYGWVYTGTGANTYRSNNAGIHSSTASMKLTATASCELFISYQVSSESGYDTFHISNSYETIVSAKSGEYDNSFYYTLNYGDYLIFEYSKDSSQSSYNDCAIVSIMEM